MGIIKRYHLFTQDKGFNSDWFWDMWEEDNDSD